MSILSKAARKAAASAARASASGKSWAEAKHFIPKGLGASRLNAVGLGGIARSAVPHFVKLAKSDPAKFVAGALAWATIDHYTDNWLDELESAAKGDQATTKTIQQAREQIKELKVAFSAYEEEDEDNKVGDHDLDAFSIVAYKEAKVVFERAASIVGGRNRLIALQEFFQLDADLKHLVIEDSIIGAQDA